MLKQETSVTHVLETDQRKINIFATKMNQTTLDHSNSSYIYIPLGVVLIKNETLFCMLENCPYFYLLFCCNYT